MKQPKKTGPNVNYGCCELTGGKRHVYYSNKRITVGGTIQGMDPLHIRTKKLQVLTSFLRL